MGIQQIVNTIKGLFSNTRPPFPLFPGLLIVCSMCRRPGLSTIRSTGKIITDLAKMGIPSGQMPEGCPNATVGFVYSLVDDVYRGVKEDSIIQLSAQPGSIDFAVTGAGGGTGTNLNTGKVCVRVS